ncbi:MAG TPA: hypothetical protein VEA63_02505, partial [Opitutus sp.]|nr:hypothetical protein [Opitutus sp.]
MPTLPLRWFLMLVGLFALVGATDLYFSHVSRQSQLTAADSRIDAADFFAAARAGELKEGHIVYRGHALGLAELVATRTVDGTTRTVRSAARLTDADLLLLRERRFLEEDTATYAAKKATAAELTAKIAHGAVAPIGIITLLAGIIVVAQRYAGRFTAFSSRRLQPVTSVVKFSSVAGCDEAKDEVHEV